MTTETTVPAPIAEAPQPSAEQLARRQRRQRFYRLRVILPMALVTLLWIVLVLVLLWITVGGEWFAVDTNQTYYRTLVSGIADAVLIVSMLPLLLLCALPSGLAVGLVFYRRQRQAEQPALEVEKLPLFWRIENAVVQVRQRLNEDILPKMAEPLISAYAAVAFIRAFLKELREIIDREITRYVRR